MLLYARDVGNWGAVWAAGLLQAVAEANGCSQQQPEELCASAEEFAKYFWSRDFSMDSSQ